MMRVVQALILVLLLGGCSSLKSMLADKGLSSYWYQAQSASMLDHKVEATHYVTFDFDGKVFTSINQIEWDNEQFALGAYSHLGGALFSLTYKDNELHSKISPVLPPYFKVGYVLRDYQLAFLPLSAVAIGIVDDSVHVSEVNRERVFTRDGEELITVQYQDSDPWVGDVLLMNREYGYSITFKRL